MNRLERDKFIAWVGYTNEDIIIWGQYEKMVDFIFDEYPKSGRRFDEISNPLLFVISHCLELALKECIKHFRRYTNIQILTKFEDWTSLLKSHNLIDLASEFKIIFNRFHKQVNGHDDDKKEFNAYFDTLISLLKLLERNTETYRYSIKLDKEGALAKESIPKEKQIDLQELKNLFDEVKLLFVGAINSMGIYTDYLDFIEENPAYTNGLGYLYCLKLHYSPEFLERLKNYHFEKQGLIQLKENIWMSQDTGENFELVVWQGNIYIIAVNPKMV